LFCNVSSWCATLDVLDKPTASAISRMVGG